MVGPKSETDALGQDQPAAQAMDQATPPLRQSGGYSPDETMLSAPQSACKAQSGIPLREFSAPPGATLCRASQICRPRGVCTGPTTLHNDPVLPRSRSKSCTSRRLVFARVVRDKTWTTPTVWRPPRGLTTACFCLQYRYQTGAGLAGRSNRAKPAPGVHHPKGLPASWAIVRQPACTQLGP